MKGRWIKIGVAVAVLALLGWIGSHLRFIETTVPLPLQGEALTNPYYAAIEFSERLRAEASWERVFQAPPEDAVVVISNWNWSLSRHRRERLQEWVQNGGRLVVDDSLLGGAEDFEKWAGVGELDHSNDDEAQSSEDSADASEADEESQDDEPGNDEPDGKKKRSGTAPNQGERALLEQFMTPACTALTEDTTNRAFSVCGVDESRSLTSSRKLLWALRADKKIHALRVAVGRGSVTVINAAPFRSRQFLLGDHPDLFVAAAQLRHGDVVRFFTEGDHASLLALTWRHGAPVVLLLGALIALALWRNIPRFGPLAAIPDKARRSLAEQIRGTGQFTLRFGGGRALHAALVRALREAAIRRLPGYDRLSAEERVEVLAKLTGVLASELGPALNYSGARNSHELRNVIAVLETARRRLSTSKKRAKA